MPKTYFLLKQYIFGVFLPRTSSRVFVAYVLEMQESYFNYNMFVSCVKCYLNRYNGLTINRVLEILNCKE